jgi:hypothetical protein
VTKPGGTTGEGGELLGYWAAPPRQGYPLKGWAAPTSMDRYRPLPKSLGPRTFRLLSWENAFDF